MNQLHPTSLRKFLANSSSKPCSRRKTSLWALLTSVACLAHCLAVPVLADVVTPIPVCIAEARFTIDGRGMTEETNTCIPVFFVNAQGVLIDVTAGYYFSAQEGFVYSKLTGRVVGVVPSYQEGQIYDLMGNGIGQVGSPY